MSDDAHFKWRWAKLPWYQHRRGGKLCKIKCSNWAPRRISTLTRAPGDGGENKSLGQFEVVLGVKLIVVQPLLLSFADLRSSPFSFCWFAEQPLPPSADSTPFLFLIVETGGWIWSGGRGDGERGGAKMSRSRRPENDGGEEAIQEKRKLSQIETHNIKQDKTPA